MEHLSELEAIQKTLSLRSRPTSSDLSSSSKSKSKRALAQRSLLYCLQKGYFRLIRYLLESGIGDARERDGEGRTGLIYCCFINDDCWAKTTAMTLLERGAQIADQDHRGLNALHYAIITQRFILIRLYLDSLDFDFTHSIDIHGNTCLHYACATGDMSIVRAVLIAMKRYAVDLTITNRAGLTAYDIACQFGFAHCQNLIRNEMTLQERANLSKTLTKSTVVRRRLSVSERIDSLSPSSRCNGSVTSLPYFVSSSTNIRQRRDSTADLKNESHRCTSAKLIDPPDSRTMAFKRNQHLDVTLMKQAKSRADFAPSTFNSASEVFNSTSTLSSSTDLFHSPSAASWRDNVPKIFDQLQILRSPSYRRTVHPPLQREIPPDFLASLYNLNDGNESARNSTARTLSANPLEAFQKLVRKQRTSVSAMKALNKMKN